MYGDLRAALGFVLATARPHLASANWIILHGKTGHVERNVPAALVKVLNDHAKTGVELKSVAFTPSGGWIVLYGKNNFVHRGIPKEAVQVLAEHKKKGMEFKTIDFSPGGGWTAFLGKGFQSQNIGVTPFDKLVELEKQDHKLKAFSFTPNGGWAILGDTAFYYAWEVPLESLAKMNELGKKNAELKSITFAPGGGWVILYNKNGFAASKEFPAEAAAALEDLAKKGSPIKSISFLPVPFIPLARDDAETRNEVLRKMMQAEVPGLGAAVVQNGKLAWARGYGVLCAGQKMSVTDQTCFPGGSDQPGRYGARGAAVRRSGKTRPRPRPERTAHLVENPGQRAHAPEATQSAAGVEPQRRIQFERPLHHSQETPRPRWYSFWTARHSRLPSRCFRRRARTSTFRPEDSASFNNCSST